MKKKTTMSEVMKIAAQTLGCKIEDLSDGFHSYKDLYEQRLVLSAALTTALRKRPFEQQITWKSYRHPDGTPCYDGQYFLTSYETPEGPYSYHYPSDEFGLFKCERLPIAKPFDGHTSKDVRRLLSIPEYNPEPLKENVGKLLDMVGSGKLTPDQAKELFAKALAANKNVDSPELG